MSNFNFGGKEKIVKCVCLFLGGIAVGVVSNIVKGKIEERVSLTSSNEDDDFWTEYEDEDSSDSETDEE